MAGSINDLVTADMLDDLDEDKADNYAVVAGITASRILTNADLFKVLEVNSATAITLTVPLSLFPGGTLEIYVAGAGQVTLAPASGLNLRSRGDAFKSAGQYATLGLRVRAVDEVVAFGDLTT